MKTEKAIFACGCFWGAQHHFERAKGVVRSTVGYIGGYKEHPTYQEVKAHVTGHAEATEVEYDPAQTSFIDLCKLFFEIHDPFVKRFFAFELFFHVSYLLGIDYLSVDIIIPRIAWCVNRKYKLNKNNI